MSEIVYTWNFNPLEVVFNEESMANVIDMVHWQYTATFETASATSIGVVKLDTPVSESFVAYEDVTKTMVTEWVEAKLGQTQITALQTNLSSSINTQLFPTRGPLSPPWV